MATTNRNTTPPAAAPQEPTAGGSYVRGPDGSLTLMEQTKPANGRAARAPDPAAPASAGSASTQNQE